MSIVPRNRPMTTTGAQQVRRTGRVGYVPGVFDMFHIGHLNILRNARAYCDHVIVGVVSDEKALRAKGALPVVPLTERLEIVQHCTLVDEAVPEFADSKVDMWEELRFDVILKGDDWKETPQGRELEALFAPLGVEVSYFPYTKHTSSRLLRSVLNEMTS